MAPTVAARQFATLDQLTGGRRRDPRHHAAATTRSWRRTATTSTKDERYARTDEYLDIAAPGLDRRGAVRLRGRVLPGRAGLLRGEAGADAAEAFRSISAAPREAAIAVAGRTPTSTPSGARRWTRSREMIGARPGRPPPHGRTPRFSLSFRPILAETEEARLGQGGGHPGPDQARCAAAGPRRGGAAAERGLAPAAGGRRQGRAPRQAALDGDRAPRPGRRATPPRWSARRSRWPKRCSTITTSASRTFLIRGFDPLEDAIQYGRDLLPAFKAALTERRGTRRRGRLMRDRVFLWLQRRCSRRRAAPGRKSVLRVGDQRGNAARPDGGRGCPRWPALPARMERVSGRGSSARGAQCRGDRRGRGRRRALHLRGRGRGAGEGAIMASQQDRTGWRSSCRRIRRSNPGGSQGQAHRHERGSIGHQVVLAALERRGLPSNGVALSFLPPADAKLRSTSGPSTPGRPGSPTPRPPILAGWRAVVRDGNGITPGLGFQVALRSDPHDKRPLLADFAARLAKARAWAIKDPCALRAELVEADRTAEGGAFALVPPCGYRPVPIDSAVIADEQRTIDLYVRPA